METTLQATQTTVGAIDRSSARSVVGEAMTPAVRAGSFEVHEVTGPVDSGPPPHSHGWDEAYVVLAGRLVVSGDDTEHELGEGGTASVPAGSLHWYRIAAEGTRFLTITSGTSAGAFFDDVDATVPHGPPDDSTMGTLIEVARRNGLSSPLFGD